MDPSQTRVSVFDQPKMFLLLMKYHMEYLMDAFFQNLIKFRIKYVLAKLARQLCAPKHVTTLFLTRCEHNANLNNNRY
jgi:hypothetical protein